MDDVFADTSYGKAALKKLAPVPENFQLYFAGIAGDIKTSDTMEVRGCVFRKAAAGPRKGELCIMVPGTVQTVFVSNADMKEFE